MHTSNLIREEPFEAQVAEPHPMISGLEKWSAPPLLGYVKTLRRAAAQVPLVTAAGDPLLAQWRFGLGKVSAFTSDASERWAALWTGSWRDFGVFWAQVLRDTARVGQSRRMDIECAPADDAVRVQVDLRDDGGSWARGAEVRAEWFFVPPDAMGGTLTALQSVTLEQQAPGRFEKLLPVDKPGVYLLRAQALGETGSAGYVYQPSGEAAGGEAQEESLRRLTEITGGVMLDGSDDEVPLNAPVGAAGFREVWPPLALTAFVLFLVDVVIRRWDHVRSLLRRSSPAG
ncbi:MAG: hypothetical protein KDK99_22280, partial [Verrucomicrobiales bacterium]|nr:hypothetical protein [Verrucomicrobiales bacterium]